MVTNWNTSQSDDTYGIHSQICKAFNIDLPQIYTERTDSSGMEGYACICIDKREVNQIMKIMNQLTYVEKHVGKWTFLQISNTDLYPQDHL